MIELIHRVAVVSTQLLLATLLLMLIGTTAVYASPERTLALYVEGTSGQERENVLAYLGLARLVDSKPSAIIDNKLTAMVPLLTSLLEQVDNQFKHVEKSLQSKDFVGKQPLDISDLQLRWIYNRSAAEVEKALEPFGYYQPRVDTSLTKNKEGNWVARIEIREGPVVRLTKVQVKIIGDGANNKHFQGVRSRFPLSAGDKLEQKPYEDFKRELELLATEEGYFDARFTEHTIDIDVHRQTAAIDLVYDTGRRYRFGAVAIQGGVLSSEFVDRFLDVEPKVAAGDPYDANALMALQGRLIAAGYFSRVEMDVPRNDATDYRIPVNVKLAMKKQKQLTMGIGYGTDTGVRGKLGLDYHWINRWGHSLKTGLVASQIKYGGSASYIIPGTNPVKDRFSINTTFTREDSSTQDSINFTTGVDWTRLFDVWQVTLSADYAIERFNVNEARNSLLFVPGITISRKMVNDPLRIKHGSLVSLKVQGARQKFLSNVSFLQARLDANWIYSFSNRDRLIAHGSLGYTIADDFPKLPTSYRFFAGGDNSVRGYGFEKITPRDDENNALGGRRLVIASLEYEHRFSDNFGLATFVDAGDAYNASIIKTNTDGIKSTVNFNSSLDLKFGIGAGLRWYLPFGPIRLDFAHGLSRPPGSNFRIHFTLGPEF